MSEEEIAAAAARLAEGFQARAEQGGRRPGCERPKSARQLKREEKARQAEEMRKRSIASMYKQLARAVHPDLEQDAERRRQKETVMQELTAAYRNNDLHTLLRLELEWIRREEGDLDRMNDRREAGYLQWRSRGAGGPVGAGTGRAAITSSLSTYPGLRWTV